MLTDQMRLTCRSCGQETLLKDLKYAQNKKDLYCIKCLDQKTRVLPKVSEEAFVQPKQRNKTSYSCKKCGYRFNLKPGSQYTKRCPYCGKTDYLHRDSEFTTARLLREVSEDNM